MRIGIDARFITHPQPGGFKTYTTNLIAALAEIDKENEYILYLDREPEQETKLPESSNFKFRVVPGLTPLVGMPWREQVGIPKWVAHDQVNLLHSPSLTAPLRLACPSVVSILDIIWYFPKKFSSSKTHSVKRELMGNYYRYVPKKAAHRATAVITISEASKVSLVQHLGIASDQIYVTYLATSTIYKQVHNPEILNVIKQKYRLASNFILAIGSADPRKNCKTLVQAYASLPESLQERYQLAIVWTHALLIEELTHLVEVLGLRDRVKFLQSVCDEDLVLLYNAASLFVFPSLYEGFGLPPLEAMACGTPVVAANNSSIPEIVGDGALLTDAEDVMAVTESIAKVLNDKTLQQGLIENGLKRAAGFSWEKCARQTLEIYKLVYMSD